DRVAGRRGGRLATAGALGLLGATAAVAGRGQTGRQDDLQPAAADLDGHALALLGLGRLGPLAGVRRDLVVEVGFDPGGVDVEGALARRVRGGDVRRVLQHRAVERDHRWLVFDLELRERPAGPLDGLGAVAAGDDELGDQ